MNEQLKRQMPQVDSRTGVSNDYSNQITTLRLDFLDGNREKIIKKLKKRKVKRYEEVYPVSRYNDVITEKNKNAISRLNELADNMNYFAKDEFFNDNEFVSVYNEMLQLIYGPEHGGEISVEDFGSWNK